MRPNRPHIPSFIQTVKERGNKIPRPPKLSAHPLPCIQDSLCDFRRVPSASDPVSVHLRFGEAVFTETRRNPQEEKTQKMTFFQNAQKVALHLGVGAIFGTISRRCGADCCAR
jgi:hypothetical protein